MQIVKNKNHLQRNFWSSLSENFSGDVIHSILSNPTDTLQALNESDLSAKIRNTTQSAKNKLKKFFNGDFSINYNGTFAQIRHDLRKLLSLNLEGRSDYAVYDTPNGKMAFRLTDHNANGNNFIQDDAEINISVYVAFNEYEHVDTDVHYKEYKILPEVFKSKRVECINAIITAVNNALNGDEFEIDSGLAQMQEYNKPMASDEEEIDTEEIENNVLKTESKYMNKKQIRLTESHLHRIIKESVNKVLNEIGDSDKSHEYLGNIAGYYDSIGDDEKAKRAYNLSTQFQKNRNNGQLYDVNSEDSAAEYRRNSRAFTKGYDTGWDKGRNKMSEATADPRWWRKDGGFPDMKDDQYIKPKQQVKISEAQLHQIIKESIQKLLGEAYSDAQYAHLAGQASGALNSFGGKLKGMFNPNWKARKERQMRKFANQATGDGYQYGNSSTKGGDNNYGRKTVNMSGNDYTYEHGGTRDYIENNFNAKNKENPFEMQRSQRYVEPKANGSRPLSHNGEVYSRKDVADMRNYYGQDDKNFDHDKYNEYDDVMHGNGQLNRAFQQGQQARKGGTYNTVGGTTYTNGTGTSSGAFKRLK